MDAFHKNILEWNNGAVLAIAQRIKDDNDLEAFPILADALEDAGCTDNDILDHCRNNPGEDSWVLDILYKERLLDILHHGYRTQIVQYLIEHYNYSALCLWNEHVKPYKNWE